MSDYGAIPIPNAKTLFDLTGTKQLANLPKTNAMEWEYVDGNVIKLANRQDKTNILFKME